MDEAGDVYEYRQEHVQPELPDEPYLREHAKGQINMGNISLIRLAMYFLYAARPGAAATPVQNDRATSEQARAA